MFLSITDHNRGIRQSNTAYNQISHFCTQLTWCKRVKWVKFRHFFVDYLYEYDILSWKHRVHLMKVSTVLYLFDIWGVCCALARFLYGVGDRNVLKSLCLQRFVMCLVTL